MPAATSALGARWRDGAGGADPGRCCRIVVLLESAHRAVEFRAGMLALAPMLLGVVPFGLIYGVLATSAGMPAWLAVVMSAIVFGGASQMILVQLWAGGAPALVIAATVSMVNLRHALYSASIAPALAHLPRRWKWLIAYLLTDEAFAGRPTVLSHRMQHSHRSTRDADRHAHRGAGAIRTPPKLRTRVDGLGAVEHDRLRSADGHARGHLVDRTSW